jgi:hypothetical protein
MKLATWPRDAPPVDAGIGGRITAGSFCIVALIVVLCLRGEDRERERW